MQFSCQNESRLRQVRKHKGAAGQYLNGIDYLEIGSEATTLILHLIRDLPPNCLLNQENLLLEGGNIPVEIESVSSFANLVTIKVSVAGDRSTYTLRLVESLARLVSQGVSNLNEPPPPQGFDPQLAQIDFSWPKQVSEFDCQPLEPPADKPEPPPNIDYLAKDYASFRQLMLDRLAITAPQWRERNPSDLGIMLVELLAYAADHLSYYQDAVATEAYLGTARKRISVRRHSRLLDYLMHDGCNARAWVTVKVHKKVELPGPSAENQQRGIQLLTRVPTLKPGVIASRKVIGALNLGAQVFETMHNLTLHPACNEIQFYTWGNEQFELAKGTTKATLKDNGGQLEQCLKVGAVLLLLEKLNPDTGQENNIDLTHRHAVRLTEITADEDPLFKEDSPEGKNQGTAQRVLKIAWSPEDALPFSLTVARVIHGQQYFALSVAQGNVVLADYGRTVPNEPLPEPQKIIAQQPEDSINRDAKILDPKKLNFVPDRDRYRPRLKRGVLTQQGYILDRHQKWVLFDPEASATAAFDWQMRHTRPAMHLREHDRDRRFDWQLQRDLLNSDRFARDFVVETEDDGSAHLRFGDHVLGKKPTAGNFFEVTYRIGNGTAGNVGADSIAYLVTDDPELKNAIATVSNLIKNPISNPLPAQGGIEPESIEQVRLYAPQAFRQPQRAVTTKDYAQMAERHPEVQRAVAVRRWTGSWYTIFIYIDRKQGLSIDQRFKDKLLNLLKRFRLAGHDIAIEAPRFVPLDLALTVQVQSDHFRSEVKGALLEVFSDRVLPNGQLGRFHPDRLTFGEPVYLSQLLETAVKVEGVLAVEFTRFQRQDQPLQNYRDLGQIPINALEIARLDNNPAEPKQGQIEFNMEGGL